MSTGDSDPEEVSTRPRVDVGVVTWNTRDLTVAALRHLLDDDQGCDLRLLVRDNDSGDGTVAALAESVPEAAVDAGMTNLGFAAGVNTLLARSEAPWFLALNSDAWPAPGAIRRLVETARARPRAAIVTPRLERPDGTLEHSTHPFPSLRVAAWLAAAPRSMLRGPRGRRLLLEGAWRHDELTAVDWAVGAAWLMRRRAIEEVGGLDERFFMYAEDLEWCWRVRRHGWEIWFDPNAVVRHVGNASGTQSYGERRTVAYMHNTYRFYRSTHGAASTFAYRSLNLFGTVRLYAKARLRGDAEAASRWRSQFAADTGPIPPTDGPPLP